MVVTPIGCVGWFDFLVFQQRVNFRNVYPEASLKSIDLMERMLQFDPRKRITVEEALQHPYLAQLHDPASEPSAPRESVLSLTQGIQINCAGWHVHITVPSCFLRRRQAGFSLTLI